MSNRLVVPIHERFVVLDRDGVINEDSDDYIKGPEEWVPIGGSIEGIAALTAAGVRVAVVTNQSGLARRYFDVGAVNAIHRRLYDMVTARGGRIEMILFCPHGPGDACACRKPEVGLLEQLVCRTGSQLIGMPFVGDSLSDLRAATRFHMEPVLVLTGKGRKTVASGGVDLQRVSVFENLRAAANDILARWRSS